MTACAADGTGHVLVLHGEAGIGKTTLAERAIDAALEAGLDVWTATASELDGMTPLGILQRLRSHAGDALLEQDPTANREKPTAVGTGLVSQFGPEVERFAVAESVIEAVEARAQRPTLIVAEDLHWADPASLQVLGQVALAALTHPLVLLVTHRSAHTNESLDSLHDVLAQLNPLVAVVPPLSDGEMRVLVDELCGGDAGEAVHHRARGAAGNPFLVREFVDGLLVEGRALASAANHVDLPEQLRVSVGRELQRLGADLTELVRAAAIQGGMIEVRDLAAQLGSTTMQLGRPLDTAFKAGLLVDRDGELRFRHDLVRDAIYQQMPGALRAATHRELAQILARREASPALIASHLLLAGDEDADLIKQLQQAAVQTAPLAPDTALQFLDRARSLVGSDHETRRVIEMARLEALTAIGRLGEAEGVAHWLLEVSPQHELAHLNARLAGLALIAGNTERSRLYIERAIAMAPNDEAQSRYLGAAAVATATAREYGRAWQLAQQAIDLGKSVDAVIGVSIGMALIARMSTYANLMETGLSMGSQAVALADKDPTGEAHAWVPALHYGMTAFDTDQLTIAETMVARGVRLAETHRMAWALPLFGTLQAAVHLRRGAVDRAAAEAQAAVEQADLMQSFTTIMWAQSIMALASLELGSVAEARSWMDAANASWESGRSTLGIDDAALARTRVALAEGDRFGAYRDLCEAWQEFEGLGLELCHLKLAPDLWSLAGEFGDRDWQERAVASLEAAAASNQVPAVEANAQWLRAVDSGDRVETRAALDRLRRTERAVEVAERILSAPELAADLGGEAGVEAVLREALGRFEAGGALASAKRAGAALAELGSTSGHDSQAGPWELLTPTELAITELLAQGLTNAEIARRRDSSRRTIESHLGRVYQKLGIEGRVKLTVAAAEYFRPST